MKNPVFTGVCTALVTPFLQGKVNYPMLEQLIRRQTEAGIEAVVISGTTGESPTLSDLEKLSMIQRAKDFAGDSCTIIAGTGSNCTEHAIALSRAAEDAGADALLVVTPYYNKATQEGLYQYYAAIAGSVHIPVILYNVPSRTGVDISVDTCRRLAELPNIAGIKEACGDICKIARIRQACPEDFFIWSGNDDLTVPLLSLGAKGVISVLSNVRPKRTLQMVRACQAGDYAAAGRMQVALTPLIDALFSEINPIPVKQALSLMGIPAGLPRLPLTPLSATHLPALEQALSAAPEP